MAPEKLNAMLRSMSARLAGQPAHQPVLRQLDILLDSPQQFLPAAYQLGRLLVDAGLFDEAEVLYKGLTEQFPDKPQGRVCMAQLAMQRGAWEQALAYWDEVIARFSDKVTASWLGGRGGTLVQLGRLQEAEQVFRGIASDFKDDWHGLVGLAQLAMLQGFWSDALALWDEVLTRFREQANPNWQAGRASTLSQLDRLEEAEHIFRHLADDFPAQPSGWIGGAEIAVRRGAWHEALAQWDQVIARFPRIPNPSWQMARANVLVELGRADEAEALYRHIAKSNPDSLPALMGVLRVLIAKGKPEEAAIELESSHFRSLEVAGIVEKKLMILTMLKRFAEARTEFEQVLLKTNDPEMLKTLFAHTPSLHKGKRRKEIWITLLKKLDSLQEQSNLGSAAVLALRARILLALRDYNQFLALVSGSKECDLGEHWRSLLAIASRLREPSFPDYDAPKIFAIGMAKSGTSSLAAALSILGFQTLHSYNPLTHEQISEDDLPFFDAFGDAPVCANFEKCYSLFPNSKFIYTVRSFESWKKSMSDHFLRIYGHSNFADLKLALAPFMADVFNSYPTMLFKNNSYEDAYQGYDQRVRWFFRDKPKDRFLEFDVSTGGWKELCAFTGRALPSVAFPWLNRKPRASAPDPL